MPLAEPLTNQQPALDSPAFNAAAITPHATNPLATHCRAIWVGGAGTVVCRPLNASADVTFSGVPAGTLLPIAVSHVRDTSTATLMLALW